MKSALCVLGFGALVALAQAMCRAAGEGPQPPSLVRKNNCLKCHDLDQDMEKGPSFRTIAAKYKGQPDAETHLASRIATASKARYPDGHEEAHNTVKTSPPRDMAQIRGLVQWILAQ